MPNEIGHQRGPTLPFGIRIEPNKLMYRAPPRAAQVVERYQAEIMQIKDRFLSAHMQNV